MALVLLVVILSMSISLICSLCEAALYAVTPTRVEALRRTGTSSGRKLGQLRDHIDEAIAGILTLNTIAHTIGAAWAGAMVSELYGAPWMGIFSAVFTLAILFLTEIIPKSVGVAWAGVLAARLAWPIQMMIWSVWPLAWFCTQVMRGISGRAPGQGPSEEEIMVMTDLAAKGGAILPEESLWVKNVLSLNNVTARDLMTPREVIQALPADLPLERVEKHAKHWIHSRIPIIEGGNIDRVVGVVQRRVVFDQLMLETPDLRLRNLMRPALFVSEKLRGHQLLEQLVGLRQHLAIVMNETGRVTGVVSLEDVQEYLLGKPIVGEHDSHPEMQRMVQQRERFHSSSFRLDQKRDPDQN